MVVGGWLTTGWVRGARPCPPRGPAGRARRYMPCPCAVRRLSAQPFSSCRMRSEKIVMKAGQTFLRHASQLVRSSTRSVTEWYACRSVHQLGPAQTHLEQAPCMEVNAEWDLQAIQLVRSSWHESDLICMELNDQRLSNARFPIHRPSCL